MHIQSASFVTSAASPHQFLKRPIPHIVFAGKSNVGKSSILNALLRRKNLAKTSQTPGKTRLINYFLINDRFFFVDLPGYGYAKVSKKERESWGRLIETYLGETPFISLIFLLVDIRHDPSENDLQMFDWLHHSHHPFKILLTKSDKLSRNKIFQQKQRIAKVLDFNPELITPTSAVNPQGVQPVWSDIQLACQESKKRITKET